MSTDADTNPQQPFTVETFAQFWAAPSTGPDAMVPLADDVVGYWPGSEEPVRGPEQYVAALDQLLQAVPDLTLEVAEHAENGENLFIRWIATGTGVHGPLEIVGIDRIRVVDGKVKENIIRFDPAELEHAIGAKP